MADQCPGCGNEFDECTCGRKKGETPANVKEIMLYAWLGEDEHGSGVVGIKQALVPAGYIPLVAKDEFKIDREYIQDRASSGTTHHPDSGSVHGGPPAAHPNPRRPPSP
jgi:hypothetical protein